MPKGPQGQKRPADAIGLAVMVGKIATGEMEDNTADTAKAYHSEGGKKGGAARAAALSASERSQIARKAASARWATPGSAAED
ncbi:MAG: hypothetical protein JWM33_129 [Caulobacteraceae bacterium]|nr:hypothetical protein [Caulobacteraceae bacterium]